ncbi:MAG: GMP/IMP nucleotidase [Marinobacter sp.]|nr:GMP/IMP nucleotidase [Marinobacter sp.]
MINWPSLETVFLDMDGTLLDLHFDNYFWLHHLPRRYAEQHQLTPEQAQDKILPMIMAQRGTLNWYCVDYWSDCLAVDVNGLKAEVSDRIAYRPDVKDFLGSLRASGLRTVIVTNCHPKPLQLKLDRTELHHLVDDVISSHEFGKPKEDISFWSDLQRRTPYQPAQTLLVDDSLPVLNSARAAGIGHCLAILAPDSQQPPRASAADLPGIHHFREVLPAIRALGNTEA